MESSRIQTALTDIDLATFTDSYTVLHVDDDEAFADMTATFLEREIEAMNVVVETDAEAGLQRVESRRIDCIVSDFQMPGMDGIEFLEAVRDTSPDLPFILFTGQGSEEVAGRAISAGVTDYLQKESGTDQYTVLANRIENAVEQSRTAENIEQLLSALETAREGISLLDEDGNFVYLNTAYAEAFGYDQNELLGEHWENIYPDCRVEYVYDEVLPTVSEDGIWTGETTHVRKDGTKIRTDHVLSYTDSGLMICNIRALLGKRSEKERISETALDALDDLLFVFGGNGRLQYWNSSVEETTGLSPDELASCTPIDLVREEDQNRVGDYIRETREMGEARIEARVQTVSGDTVPYEFISKRVTDTASERGRRIGLGRDISEREQYEKRIERQNERLEHFAEVLSHDLRNPLSIARGRVELLYETGDEDHYEKTRDALKRIDSLITDVLTLAQTGESITLGEYEASELASIADDARGLIQQENATLTVAETAEIKSDASRLQQILENLFRNSIEHGGSDVSIRVGLLADDSGIYVADDGPGIPPERREQVFEPGYSTKTDGTGFGLATVKQIVDAHDWEIRIAESDTSGVRFEIFGVDVCPSN